MGKRVYDERMMESKKRELREEKGVGVLERRNGKRKNGKKENTRS